MKIKALIFDMDGVIMDSMGMWKTLAENYLRSMGIEPGPIFDSDLQTMNLKQGAAFMKKKFGLDKTEEQIIADITAKIKDFYLNEGKPKKGAADMLAKLKADGMRICMATATERELAEAALERNGLLDYFEFIITNTDVGKGKDDPAIFETATALLNSCKISENYSAAKAADFCSGERDVNDGDRAVTGREGNTNDVKRNAGDGGQKANGSKENANDEETAVIKKEETMIVEDSLIAIRTAVSAGFKACGVYDENEDILFPEIKETASITVMSLEELPDLVR